MSIRPRKPWPKMNPEATKPGVPVRIMRSERVSNSGFVGMEGTYSGISRVARPGAPRVLVVIDGYGPVPFYDEEVLIVGEAP